MTRAPRLLVALIAALVTLQALGACGSSELSTDDEALGGSAISSGVAGSLAFITTGLLTGGDTAGRALESRREIALAIARGSGPFVTDLAAWLELPPALLPELGQALRAGRPVLEPALAQPIAVDAFERLIGIALCKHPPIRYHAWKRFNCEALSPLSRLPAPPDPG